MKNRTAWEIGIDAKLAKSYRGLAQYWMDNRPILRSDRLDQSVEFIGEQAYQSARLAARYSTVERLDSIFAGKN